MKRLTCLGFTFAAAVLLSAQATTKQIELVDFRGEPIGTATVTQIGKKAMEIKLDVRGLPPGLHAIHFHENAKCDPPTFESAGAHFNPTGKKHGSQNEAGPHAGDLYNFRVGDDGTSKATIITQKAVLAGSPGLPSVVAGDGTSLVIHQNWDDLKTDPAGNSGPRLACGVVR